MNVPKISSKTSLFLLLLVISTLTIIPYLGLTNFHTKGEPREAIVAVSMLQNDNWILPINNGGDIAYKPPFFHWCIAALSPSCRRGNRVHFAPSFGIGSNHYGNRVFSLFCQT